MTHCSPDQPHQPHDSSRFPVIRPAAHIRRDPVYAHGLADELYIRKQRHDGDHVQPPEEAEQIALNFRHGQEGNDLRSRPGVSEKLEYEGEKAYGVGHGEGVICVCMLCVVQSHVQCSV